MSMNVENEQLKYSFYQLPHGTKKEIIESSTLKKLNIDFKDFIHPEIYHILHNFQVEGFTVKLSDLSKNINNKDKYFNLAKEFNKMSEKEYIYFIQNKRLITPPSVQNRWLVGNYFLNGQDLIETYKNMLRGSLLLRLYAPKINEIGLNQFLWQTIMASVVTIESIRAAVYSTSRAFNIIRSQDKHDESLKSYHPLSHTKAKLENRTLFSGDTSLKTNDEMDLEYKILDENIEYDSNNYERQEQDFKKLDHDMKALMSIALNQNFPEYTLALDRLFNNIALMSTTNDQDSLQKVMNNYLRSIYLLNRLAEKYIHDNIPWVTYKDILDKNQNFILEITKILEKDLFGSDFIFYVIMMSQNLTSLANNAGLDCFQKNTYKNMIEYLKDPEIRKNFIEMEKLRYLSRNNNQNNN